MVKARVSGWGGLTRGLVGEERGLPGIGCKHGGRWLPGIGCKHGGWGLVGVVGIM